MANEKIPGEGKDMTKEMKDFYNELINFYKDFITGSSDAIRALATIEQKYPKQYEIIREIKFDPSSIEKLTDNMSDKQKETFFMIFVKASLIGKKLTNLFELTHDQKIKLAEELDEFSVFVDKKLKELTEDGK